MRYIDAMRHSCVICASTSNLEDSVHQITLLSHLVSLCTPWQFKSQYGIAHLLHLYLPQYPQTEQRSLGGSRGRGALAVRYVGTLGGRFAMPDSSISTARLFLYNTAVRTFMVDFFLFFPSHSRLSEIVWRARLFAARPPVASGSSSSPGKSASDGSA